MTVGRWRVPGDAVHNPRAIVLPDGPPIRPRGDDFDDYSTPNPAKKEPAPPPNIVLPLYDKRDCPACGRRVRFNLRRIYYYSHTLPGSVEVCPQSSRP